MVFCHKCNIYPVEMEKQRFYDIRHYVTYICPRCGYVEFYREASK